MVKVSIIILSYNTEQLLKNCLQSITKCIDDLDIEVIVVDNASKDSSISMVRKTFPRVILVENRENTGFTKGNNIGVKKAKGDYLLFLNSDTELMDRGISKMVDFLNDDKKVGVIGGVLQNQNGTYQRSFGPFYSIPYIILLIFGGFGRDASEKLFFNPHVVQETDWVSGAFMMIPRDLFNKIGGFDEKIFMYVEDMELCYRVKKLGMKVAVLPDVCIKHLGQGSGSRQFAILHIYQGLLYFYKKHKSNTEYKILRSLLYTKAALSFIIGIVLNNRYLKDTYSKALKI